MSSVRAALIAGLALLALAVGLAATTTASAQGATTATTTLRPGLNLAGWTEAEADATALFEAIPRLDMAYAWDATTQRFRWAARDGSGDLRTLTPGMGLWLTLGGTEPFIWTRPMLPPGGIGLVPLREGWNFVAWSGRDGIAPGDAFRGFDGVLTEAWSWNAQAQRRERYAPGARARGNALSTLYNGSAYWLRISGETHWWQFPPRVEFPSDVTPERQAELRTLVDGVVSFFIERTGIAVPDLTVRFDADQPPCGGSHHGRVRLIRVGCFRPVPHEYTHAIQWYLRSHDQSGKPRGYGGPSVPAWIREGIANHWSGIYHDSTGNQPLDEYFPGTIYPISRRTAAKLPDLRETKDLLEGDYSAKYFLSHLAIEYLIDLASEEYLFTYYRNIFSANDWRSAFREVFGLDPARFYSMFEEHRAHEFPSYVYVSGTVLGPDGEPLKNVDIHAHSGASGVTWGPTQPDGTFRLLVEPGSYTVSFTDIHPDDCHFGWYDGDDELTAREEEAVRVTAGIFDASRIVIRLPATRAEICPRVSGTVLGPGGEPLWNVRVRADREGPDGRTWEAVTGPDGVFEYPAEPGAYTISFTGVSPNYCHFGWYDGDGELTSRGEEAVVVTVDDAGVAGIDVRLSATPDDLASTLCGRVEGVVLGPDGETVDGLWVAALRHSGDTRDYPAASTDAEGKVGFYLDPDVYRMHVHSDQVDGCTVYSSIASEPTDSIFSIPRGANVGMRIVVRRAVLPEERWTPCGWGGLDTTLAHRAQ